MPMRPMKGPLLTPELLPNVGWPKYAYPKLDGIRGLTSYRAGSNYTRVEATSASGLPLASNYLQELVAQLPVGLDGEWVYGDPTDYHCYNLTQSAVNSIEWPANLQRNQLRYYVFDRLAYKKPLGARNALLMAEDLPDFCVKLLPIVVSNAQHCQDLYEAWRADGYEGMVLRSPTAMYKEGRATESEDSFWKLKPFDEETYEAEIIGWEPLYRNAVESELTPLGLQKKSKLAESRVETNMLGSIQVRDILTGEEFWIGGGKGMTNLLRVQLLKLARSGALRGKLVRYTCTDHGRKDVPRGAQFRGFRSPIDLTSY